MAKKEDIQILEPSDGAENHALDFRYHITVNIEKGEEYPDWFKEHPDYEELKRRIEADEESDGSFVSVVCTSCPMQALHEAQDLLIRPNFCGRTITIVDVQESKTMLKARADAQFCADLVQHLQEEHNVGGIEDLLQGMVGDAPPESMH